MIFASYPVDLENALALYDPFFFADSETDSMSEILNDVLAMVLCDTEDKEIVYF